MDGVEGNDLIVNFCLKEWAPAYRSRPGETELASLRLKCTHEARRR